VQHKNSRKNFFINHYAKKETMELELARF